MATSSGLSINLDVIESMAAMAALEISGVCSMAAKKVDIKKAFSGKSVFKPVSAEIKNGAVVIDLNICISKNVNAKQVAEAVQAGVKDKDNLSPKRKFLWQAQSRLFHRRKAKPQR